MPGIPEYTYQEIAAITEGQVLQTGGGRIRNIITDTRHITSPETGLFIALSGERHDGHRYLSEAWKAGVRNFLVSKTTGLSLFPEASFICVTDTMRALQQLAGYHRRLFDIPIIAITGSNGKTIVKEWINALLSDDHIIARSPRSYNSQVGVPLSLWGIEAIHTLGVFEAGISQPGEMARLEEIILPSIGILTTIGTAHQEHFRDQDDIAREKCKLFIHCKTIIYPRDNSFAHSALQGSDYALADKISWGDHPNSSLQILSRRGAETFTELDLKWKNQAFTLVLPFADHASIENAMSCIALLLSLDCPVQTIADRTDRMTPLAMRMEILRGVNECVVINDSWSCDLDSFSIALDVARANARGKSLVVILSDIPQSGLAPDDLYGRVNSLLDSHKVTELIGVGPEIQAASDQIQCSKHFFPTTEALLSSLSDFEFRHAAILVKGAREFRFERISQVLEEKTHDTVLEVDLGALAHNFHHFRSRISAPAKVLVMVKAFGYGSGAQEVSALLEFNKADYLAVAYADEGVALRKSGISLPILVMNPEHGSFSAMLRHRLEPEIYSFRSLDQLCSTLKEENFAGQYPIHVKVDTGMRRLGFLPHEIPVLAEKIAGLTQVKIASVFSHLAASEDPLEDTFTDEQVREFIQSCDLLEKETGQHFLRHILNTGGIQRFPKYQFDMVRLGIGLYGVSAHEPDQHFLRPVGRLRTIISQIKPLRKGESVGYGRSFIAAKDMTIGIIPVGYADGLRRSLSNGVGSVAVNGRRCRIVGNVCMDMTMIDLTDIPCQEGDEVEIFGQKILLKEFAEWSGTIPYEILTSVSQRVRRIYLRE